MTRKIVFLEANEIPWRILEHYTAQKPGSCLAKILPTSRRYKTVAADTCGLSPWITWPTLHRGVNNEAHEILHFGQDLSKADANYPPIWKLLMEGGVSTGVFGPMHSSPLPADAERYDFFLPDTFAATPESHPAGLTSFQQFNLSMARSSPRNVSRSIDLSTLGGFLARAPGLGLRPSTVLSLIGQLVDERREKWKSTRRRTFQPVLAFDLFMKQLKRKKPQFSNFFTNHAASAMHRYWAALFPGDYDILELDEAWQQKYGGEILFAMDWIDRFVQRLVAFVEQNSEYLLVIGSSMGQCANNGKRTETPLYLRDLELFMERAGLRSDQWERLPAMDPDVSVQVAPDRAQSLTAYLDGMTIRGECVEYSHRDGGFFDLVFGQTNIDPDAERLMIDGRETPYESVGLELTTIEDEAGSTGYHIPEGILTVFDPQDQSVKSEATTIATTDIAPALLANFGLEIPGYMSRSEALVFGSSNEPSSGSSIERQPVFAGTCEPDGFADTASAGDTRRPEHVGASGASDRT